MLLVDLADLRFELCSNLVSLCCKIKTVFRKQISTSQMASHSVNARGRQGGMPLLFGANLAARLQLNT